MQILDSSLRILAAAGAVLLLAQAVAAQTISNSHVKGKGQEPVPRFSLHYPQERVLVVPAERTVTLQPQSDYDAIEVSGTLKVSREYDTHCKFIHLTILPGGTLDVGTPNDPVLRKVEFVVKDRPLVCGTDKAPGIDPEQFGNGVLVFGAFFVHGRTMARTWTTMEEVRMKAEGGGMNEIVTTEPMDWQVGDELLIPDTRQLHTWPYTGTSGEYTSARRESPVKIAAITGNRITLTKALDFEHQACRDPNGSVRFHPYVANATRNIDFRSENPAGTRGHCMFMETAHVNLYYASFLGLGRTRPVKIDNFDKSTGHIGTNQIARYALHWHHVHGHSDAQGLTGRAVGLFLDGSDIAKWGLVQHGTHDLLVHDCVGDRFVGSSFVTEDGFEIRGQYLRNFAMGSKGAPNSLFMGKLFVVDPATFAPGAEGAGFWFHGSMHVVRENVSINNNIGYQIMHMGQVQGRKVPKEPGGPNDTDADPRQSVPIDWSNNTAASNQHMGFEAWRQAGGWIARGQKCFHNGYASVLSGEGEGSVFDFRDLVCINQGGVGVGVHTGQGYHFSTDIDGCEIVGHDKGILECIDHLTVKNYKLRNKRNLDFTAFEMPSQRMRLTDGMFEKLTPDSQFIVVNGSTEAPHRRQYWTGNTGAWMTVENWQGTGKNYSIFQNLQQRHVPATVAVEGYFLTCPEPGLTVGQCWAKYGMAPGGGEAPDGSATMDGLSGCVAFEGQPPLGPPRAVVVLPNMAKEAEAYPGQLGRIVLHVVLTGQKDLTQAEVRVDGGEPLSPNGSALAGDYRLYHSQRTEPGTHVVTTRMIDGRGQPITGSELNFWYYVGEPTYGPLPPPN